MKNERERDIEGVILASVRCPVLVEREPAVQVARLGDLLDPDGFKNASLPVAGFCLQDLCCIPVRSVFHIPRMHHNAVLPVISFDRIFVFCDPLLQGPSCLAYVAGFAISAGYLTRLLSSSLLVSCFSLWSAHFSESHRICTPL